MSEHVQLPVSERPGAEFIGQARAFRSRILTLALRSGPEMRSITSEAVKTFKRRQAPLRPETLTEIERAWMSTCDAGCLDINIKRGRKTLAICDTRVTAATIDYKLDGDMMNETALSIIINRLTIGTTTITSDALTVAAISIHGLSRRFQRGFGNATDTAILRDLRALADAIPDMEPDHPFTILTPSAGTWRGFRGPMVEAGHTLQIANARTFV